jgi:hypothetical protein
LRVYSLPSASVLGTWTTSGNAVGSLAELGSMSLSWLADGRRLAFTIPEEPGFVGDATDVRTLNVTQPSGDLLADSRLDLRIPATRTANSVGDTCLSTPLTPDGGTVVCGGYNELSCVTDGVGLVAYSVATGKLARVLYSYRGKCPYDLRVLPLWENQSARDVIALAEISTTPGTWQQRLGLIANGRFTGISYPVPIVTGTLAGAPGIAF